MPLFTQVFDVVRACPKNGSSTNCGKKSSEQNNGKLDSYYSSFRITTIPQNLTLHDCNVEVRF